MLAVALSACGGGTTLPAGALSRGAEPSKAVVKVKIKVAIRSNARHAHFISPATKSLTLLVKQGTSTVLNQTANLTPTSTGCTTSLASLNCTLTVSLNAGSYTANVTTFDATGGTGKVLSTAQGVAFKVTSSGSNVIPLTLSGVPKSLLLTHTSGGTYYAVAQDADGNLIVGPGMPKLAVVKSSGPSVVTITQPTAAAPNKFTLALAATVALGTEKIGVNASYPAPLTNACKTAGAVCAFPSVIAATYSQIAAIGSNGNNTALGYTLPLTKNNPAPVFSQTVAGVGPVAFDTAGNFLAGSQTNDELGIFAPPYTGSPVTNGNGVKAPYAFAFDASQHLFVANAMGTVTEYAKPYTGMPLATVSNGSVDALDLALDSNANLYIGWYSGALYVVGPPYTGSATSISLASVPNVLLVSGSTLYVGESSGLEIFSLPITASSTPVASFTSFSGVTGLLLDKSGRLFVSTVYGGSQDSGQIMIFAPPFHSGDSPVTTISQTYSGLYQAGAIAFDAAGNLYVTTLAGGSGTGGLQMYAPPFTDASMPAFSVATSAIDAPSRQLAVSKAQLQLTP